MAKNLKKSAVEAAEIFYPKTQKAWRAWLKKYHLQKEAVWLVRYKKHTGQPSLTWAQSVEEALCFGWIDSKAKPIDADRSMQFFSKRKAGSTWSKINKNKIEVLIAEQKMYPAGLEAIEKAKSNGSWHILDSVEALEAPDDFASAFAKKKEGHCLL